MCAADNWSDYWEKEGSSGEVFVGKEGKKHPFLSDFWVEQFNDFAEGSQIVDLASGAGSIFSNEIDRVKFDLNAVDISPIAIEQLKSRFSDVTTLVSSLDDIPLYPESFDVVVSQFGIEYASIEAFRQAAKLLRADGKLIVLCHYRNGFIDSKNRIDLKGALLIRNSEFLDKAIALTRAAYENNTDSIRKSTQVFNKMITEITAFLIKYSEHNQGIINHCYSGFRRMYERRKAYYLDDIVGWLIAMKKEVENTILRLTEMRKASQSKNQIEKIKKLLRESGLTNVNIQPFRIPEHNLPLAWYIAGEKN